MRHWPLSTVINLSLTTNSAFPSVPLWCEVFNEDHMIISPCSWSTNVLCLFSWRALHIAILLFPFVDLFTHPETWCDTNFLCSFPSFWHFSSCMFKHLPCDYKHLRTDFQLNNSPLCVCTISQMLIMLFTHKIFTYFTFFWLWKSKKYHEIGFWPLNLNPPQNNLFYFSSVFLHFAVD